MSSIKSVLPDAAYQKFIRLRVAADELNALAHSTKNRIGELEGAMNQTSDPAVFASLKAQVGQARESMSSYQERHRSAADLLTRIENYMRAQPANTQFTMARVPVLNESGLDGLVKAISEIRSQIAGVKSDLASVKHSPPPRADIERQVAQRVDQLAKEGAPLVRIAGGRVEIDFADHTGGWESSASKRIAARLAWADPDAMKLRLLDQIDRLPEMGMAMTDDARKARISELMARLDGLERREEAMVEAALSQGHTVERRADASASAVLGIKPKATDRVRLRLRTAS